jgi:hypothetical protein
MLMTTRHTNGTPLKLPPAAAQVGCLPEDDAPSLFGLPANIERCAQQASSELVLAQLRRMSLAQVGTACRLAL